MFHNFAEGVDNVDLWKQILSDKVTSPVQIYILGTLLSLRYIKCKKNCSHRLVQQYRLLLPALGPVNQSQLSLYPNLDGCEFGGSICYLGKNLPKKVLSAYFVIIFNVL